MKGALELEGNIKPDLIMKARMGAIRSQMSASEMLSSWRYQVDADKAGDKNISLSIKFTDSNERYWLHLRNSILEIKTQAAPKNTPSVSLDTVQLRFLIAGKQQNIQGDADVLHTLIEQLDLEQAGFSMHVR